MASARPERLAFFLGFVSGWRATSSPIFLSAAPRLTMEYFLSFLVEATGSPQRRSGVSHLAAQ
jgi:hypothetical protein